MNSQQSDRQTLAPPMQIQPIRQSQWDYLTDVGYPGAPNLVLWKPMNFIRSHGGLYHFAKNLRSIKRNGIKGLFKLVSADKKKRLSSLESEILLTETEKLAQESEIFPKQVKISIITPLINTPEQSLMEMIGSVKAQTYGNWELCLADASDGGHKTEELINESRVQDARIRYRKLDRDLGPSLNLNKALEMASGEYIGILDQHDILHPSALYEVMKAVCYKGADFIYTDEAVFSGKRIVTLKYHKSDYAVDTLRSCNYISHFIVFDRKFIEQAGAFRGEFDGSQDYDLILRYTDIASKICHIPRLLYFQRSREKSGAPEKTPAVSAAENAIREHLEKRGIAARVENRAEFPGLYRVRYELTERPMVSIIIPNKDKVSLLRDCISSIIEKTTYDNYEIIIVENNSTKDVTFAYYEELKRLKNVHVVYWEGKGFNYSEVNNLGAQHARGKQLVFLNNDIKIITPDWIEEMLMYSQRRDVGVVGIKMYFLNGAIQHAGVIMGLGVVAGHIFLGAPRDALGYMARLQIVQNMSAVTAACIMIKRSVFEEAGLFDPEFHDSFNDLDLCLKVRKAGYLVVWTPYAEAYHVESKSRGYNTTFKRLALSAHEAALFKERWEKELAMGDPYYNCNLTLDRADCAIKKGRVSV